MSYQEAICPSCSGALKIECLYTGSHVICPHCNISISIERTEGEIKSKGSIHQDNIRNHAQSISTIKIGLKHIAFFIALVLIVTTATILWTNRDKEPSVTKEDNRINGLSDIESLVTDFVSCISVDERLPLVIDPSLEEEMISYYQNWGSDKWSKRPTATKIEVVDSNEWAIPENYILVKATISAVNFYATPIMRVRYFYVLNNKDHPKIDWSSSVGLMENLNEEPRPTDPKIAKVRQILKVDSTSENGEQEHRFILYTNFSGYVTGIIKNNDRALEQISRIAESLDNINDQAIGCTLLLKKTPPITFKNIKGLEEDNRWEKIAGQLNKMDDSFEIIEFLAPNWAPAE